MKKLHDITDKLATQVAEQISRRTELQHIDDNKPSEADTIRRVRYKQECERVAPHYR